MRTVFLSLLVRWFKQVLKGRIRRFARAASLAVTSAVLFIGGGAYADTRDWDPSISGGATLGGPGTWDNLTTSNWWNGAQVQWNNANNDTARFGGITAGPVTLAAGGITAGGLIFNTNGYGLIGGTLTLAGATPSISVVNAGHVATFNSGACTLVPNTPSRSVLSAANSADTYICRLSSKAVNVSRFLASDIRASIMIDDRDHYCVPPWELREVGVKGSQT